VSITKEDDLAVPLEASGDYGAEALSNLAAWVPTWFSSHLVRSRRLVTHRGAWTLLDQVFVSLTNFSTGMLIARFCSKGELGRYMLGYTVILFMVRFQQMLISSPYILIRPRLLAEEAARYTGGTYTQQFALGGALSLVLLFAALGFHVAHSWLAIVMLSLAFASPLFLFKEMFRRVCFAHLKVRSALLVDFAIGLLQISILVALALSGHLSAPMGILAIGVACGMLAIAWFLRNRRRLVFRIQDARDVLQRNWSVGRWIFGSQLLWAASLYSYPWLISRMHGLDAAGVWAVCFGINALANPLLLGLQNYVEPRISHAFADGGMPRMRSCVWRATGILTMSMLLFSALILFAGNLLTILLYGAKYAGYSFTLFVLTLSSAAGAAGFAFSCGFFAAGRGRLDLRISWVYPVIVCAVGLPLVRGYGPLGAATSLLIANTLASSLLALQFLITFRKDAAYSS
jgi:O-antigen/teichoic acid export membrane protein